MTVLETEGRKRNAFFTADELMDTDFPEPRWAVPGLVAEGVTLLGGAPKLGKSWLCLDLGISIASGGPALGKIEVTSGKVLYAALEDPPRRLKSRLTKLLGAAPAPQDLTVVTELPAFTVALDMVSEWLEATPDARLVIIDVLAKIRPPAPAGKSVYEADYEVLARLKKLADAHRVAVLVVTHTRKMEASDVFDQVAGSTGLTGAADATIVLKRSRGENSAALHVTGRDIVESEYALTFDPTHCLWTLDGNGLGEAAQKAATNRVASGLGDKAAEILDLLAKNPTGMGPTAVGEAVGLSAANAGQYLRRLADKGRVEQTARGRYACVKSVKSVKTDSGADVIDFSQFSQFSHPHGDE